ncbi:MAG: hypothetical protein Q8Q18_02970 [bacterium]|nr:hypothetical protein [bacterium]
MKSPTISTPPVENYSNQGRQYLSVAITIIVVLVGAWLAFSFWQDTASDTTPSEQLRQAREYSQQDRLNILEKLKLSSNESTFSEAERAAIISDLKVNSNINYSSDDRARVLRELKGQ